MPRALLRYCKKGHDTQAVGRDVNSYCRACKREGNRRNKQRARAPQRIPAGEILPQLERLIQAYTRGKVGGGQEVSRILGEHKNFASDLMHGRQKSVSMQTFWRLEKAEEQMPYPGEPLYQELQRAIARYSTSFSQGGKDTKQQAQIGINTVLRAYAERYGITLRAATRHYSYVRKGLVPPHIADQFCTFLGTHIDLLWPEMETV